LLPVSELIEKISDVYKKVEPEIIYMPFAYDVHTDHQITARAIQSTLKWFRYPHVKKVLMYETPSETEFNFLGERAFRPNVFMDISDYLEIKINAMKIFSSEMGEFPFPRSGKNIRSLARFRGCQSGFFAAEAFELVYERK
jgi:LmbE family N-acetylglucosaminyl deacetylase